jgi:hypothetical protein
MGCDSSSTDVGTVDENNSSGSNSEGNWEYEFFFTGYDNERGVNYDETDVDNENRFKIAPYFTNVPDSSNYGVSPEDCTHRIILPDGDHKYDIEFFKPEPNDNDTSWSGTVDISVGLGPVSAGLSYGEARQKILDWDYYDYIEWNLSEASFPDSQCNTTAANVDIGVNYVDDCWVNAKSTYSWDYIDYSQDTMPTVMTETESVSDGFYIHGVDN